jgi:hypothetical protein
MKIQDHQWERGCCNMQFIGKDAAGNAVVLTRNYGAEMTRVEVYGPDNQQIGELRELPNAEAEALV